MSLIKKFEEYIFYILTGFLVVYILIEVVELFYVFGRNILIGDSGERLLISKEQTQETLPVFFSILIAIELIDTFNVYIKSHSVKVLNILLIGLIAIGRKLLTLDFAHADGLYNIGLGLLILSISLGYFLVKKSLTEAEKMTPDDDHH